MAKSQIKRRIEVCKRWNEFAQKVKQARKHIFFNAVLYDKASAKDQIDTVIGHQIQSLLREPSVCLLLCSSDLNENSVYVPSQSAAASSRYPRAAKMEKLRFGDYMKRSVPRSCQVYGTATDGIIGTDDKTKKAVELERSEAAQCLLFPKLEGVDMYGFYASSALKGLLSGYQLTTPSFHPESQAIEMFTGIPQNKHAKVILLFTTGDLYHYDSTQDVDYGSALLMHYHGKTIIAGGVTDDFVPEKELESENEREREAYVHGLAFCGDNIKMASVCVKGRIKDVNQKLQKLKDCHVPEERTIGFMFACVGRGINHYDGPNVEADAFKKLFPDVPLYGFFGNGEIGYDFLPDYSKDEETYKNYTVLGEYEEAPPSPYVFDLPDLYHSYTTIFVLLHFGDS